MYDMIQSFPSQREALLWTLDHTKQMPNANTQKALVRKVNIAKVMPTMFKDRLEVPPFLLSISIYGKNLHDCLID